MGAPPPPRRPDAAAVACDLRDHADLFYGLPDHSHLASDLDFQLKGLLDLAVQASPR